MFLTRILDTTHCNKRFLVPLNCKKKKIFSLRHSKKKEKFRTYGLDEYLKWSLKRAHASESREFAIFIQLFPNRGPLTTVTALRGHNNPSRFVDRRATRLMS